MSLERISEIFEDIDPDELTDVSLKEFQKDTLEWWTRFTYQMTYLALQVDQIMEDQLTLKNRLDRIDQELMKKIAESRNQIH